MNYLVRLKKKVFSRSGERMIEEYRTFEFDDQKKASLFAKNQSELPSTVSVRIFKEDQNVK